MSAIDITTSDGLKIAGIYTPGSLPFGAILLHMMPATKESYTKLASDLSEIGLHTLAIDFRGHGQSEGGNYKEFTDEQHQKYILDLEAAVNYLKSKEPAIKFGIVGASIGCSIGIWYGTEHELEFLALLSPGIEYRGVKAGELIQKLPDSLPTYFASAMDDARVPGNSTQTETLYNACSSKAKKIQMFQTGGHGTEILENNPDFKQSLVAWIKESAKIQ
jgi:esterase/lipase